MISACNIHLKHTFISMDCVFATNVQLKLHSALEAICEDTADRHFSFTGNTLLSL